MQIVKFINIPPPVIFPQQSAAMGSSKHFSSTLKIKMIDAHKGEESFFKYPWIQFGNELKSGSYQDQWGPVGLQEEQV